MEKEIISRIKHIQTFYEEAPPGYVKDEEERPEDCIPDEECNQAARDFLANAPSKGLWMPLGKEVKVMQCWRCKQYGHRTGDKECPLFKSGNAAMEKFREVYEDPMYHFVESSKREENEKKKLWLQQLLDKSTSESSSDEGDSKKRKLSKKSKKSKKKSKKSKHKSRKSSHDIDSDSDRESSNCDRVRSKGRSDEKKSSRSSEKKSSKNFKRIHKERDGHSSSKKKCKS